MKQVSGMALSTRKMTRNVCERQTVCHVCTAVEGRVHLLSTHREDWSGLRKCLQSGHIRGSRRLNPALRQLECEIISHATDLSDSCLTLLTVTSTAR